MECFLKFLKVLHGKMAIAIGFLHKIGNIVSVFPQSLSHNFRELVLINDLVKKGMGIKGKHKSRKPKPKKEKEEKRKDGGKKVGQEFHEEERKEDKQEHGDIRQNFSHEEFDAIPAEGEESILVNGRLGQMK